MTEKLQNFDSAILPSLDDLINSKQIVKEVIDEEVKSPVHCGKKRTWKSSGRKYSSHKKKPKVQNFADIEEEKCPIFESPAAPESLVKSEIAYEQSPIQHLEAQITNLNILKKTPSRESESSSTEDHT